MKSLKLLCVLPMLFAASLVQADSICAQPHLATLVRQGLPAFENKSLKRAIGQSQVVIAGDVHFLTDFTALAKITQEFQKQHTKKSCVAFELPQRKYDTDFFMNNIVDIVAESEANPTYKTDVDLQNYVDTLKRLHIYYFPIVHNAVELKMKVKSVDHKDKWGPMPMDVRNQAISENISSLFQSKECDSVLLIIGKAHLSQDAGAFRIQNLLKSKKLKVASVNLQMTRESTIPENIRSWEICADKNLPALADYSVIDNTVLAGQPILTGATLWKDFDFTLLIP